MSDGNYNRNLLPYNNYKSGFNAGRMQMKKNAEIVFIQWFKSKFPFASDEDLEENFRLFKAGLDKK